MRVHSIQFQCIKCLIMNARWQCKCVYCLSQFWVHKPSVDVVRCQKAISQPCNSRLFSSTNSTFFMCCFNASSFAFSRMYFTRLATILMLDFIPSKNRNVQPTLKFNTLDLERSQKKMLSLKSAQMPSRCMCVCVSNIKLNLNDVNLNSNYRISTNIYSILMRTFRIYVK